MLSIIADSRRNFSWRRLARRLRANIPTDCPLCEGPAAGARLCAGCEEDMTRAMRGSRHRCARCAQRGTPGATGCAACAVMTPGYDKVIAGFDYEPPFDCLIGRYKSEHRFGLSTALAHVLADAVRRAAEPTPARRPRAAISTTGIETRRVLATALGQVLSDPADAPVLVPIPSSDASLRRRGFNPAGELATSLGSLLGLRVRRDVLRRRREGPRQTHSARAARLHATAGLFETVGGLDGCSIGLVDDVMTTGATVNDACAALLRAGAARVTVLVAARTPLRQPPGPGGPD